jgi:hypothetical protein
MLSDNRYLKCSFVKVAWRLLHSIHGLAIFTRVTPNDKKDVYFTGFVIVKLIAQDPFHWLSAPFPIFFFSLLQYYMKGNKPGRYTANLYLTSINGT